MAPPISFIEDSFEPPSNFVGSFDVVEAIGCADTETAGEDANEDNCKEKVEEGFVFESEKLEDFEEKFSEFLQRKVVDTDDLESETGKDLVALAEEGCKFSKTYTVN